MKSIKNEWTIAGLMSGTSIDGLDIAVCKFKKNKNNWTYTLIDKTTIPYHSRFKNKISSLIHADAQSFCQMDAAFGRFSGMEVLKFIKNKPYKIDFIASHGHTIFHQPQNGFTFQIGNGAYIHATTKLPVVSDFRTIDVGLKGQGAPLVPIGDALLFNEFAACINLGGIANISFDQNRKRIAGDICSVNLILNHLAEKAGKPYDKNGKMASLGKVNADLLKKLNSQSFLKKPFPKSLGKEWVEKYNLNLLEESKLSLNDKMTTCCEHIAMQLASILEKHHLKGKILFTGGGAFNTFLMKRIRFHTTNNCTIVLLDPSTIAYKEAIIFAFLGLKRILGEVNTLKSVTGATMDSVGGALYGNLNP